VARPATRHCRLAAPAPRAPRAASLAPLRRGLPAARAAALAALLGAACGAEDGAGPADPDTAGGGAIGFRGDGPDAPCSGVQFRASTPTGMRPVPLAELVVAVNGRVCHREGVPGHATVHGELAAACPEPDEYQPGPNLIEAVLLPPSRGARASPLARRRAHCAGPERD
jgi:hypothetical protein